MYSRPSTNTSWPDVINLLADLIVFEQYEFDEFLHKLIDISLEVVPVDSCFIYFYDKDEKKLNLIASKKPYTENLQHITLESGEGITGWVAKHQQTVSISTKAYEDVRFKPFEELPEDKFEAFLSVPIVDAVGVAGVINFQNREGYAFQQEQIKVIEAIAKIISSAFAKIVVDRKLNSLEEKLEERKIIEKAKGILMQVKKISEDEAFKIIRSEAMNKRKSMKDIAEAILLISSFK